MPNGRRGNQYQPNGQTEVQSLRGFQQGNRKALRIGAWPKPIKEWQEEPSVNCSQDGMGQKSGLLPRLRAMAGIQIEKKGQVWKY